MQPPLKQSTRNMIDCIADSPVWGKLLPTIERLADLQSDLDAILPESLKRKAQVSSLTEDDLALSVSTAAIAAKLRQTLPSIQAGLQSRGWKVSSIRLRVQPSENPVGSTGYTKAPQSLTITSQAQASLTALQASLDDGPLRDAVARLCSR